MCLCAWMMGLIVREKKPVSPNHLAEYIHCASHARRRKSPKMQPVWLELPSQKDHGPYSHSSVGRSPENTTSMKMSHHWRMFTNDEDTRWVGVHWSWHAFMGIWRFFSRSRTHPVLELSQQMMMLAKTTRKERRRGGKGNADSATLIFLPIPISGQNIKSIHHLNSVLCSVFVSNHFAWFDQLISIPNRAWQVRLGSPVTNLS